MGRRFLQRLQQRVEGVRREHVHFVDEVDLVAASRGSVLDVVEQLAGVVDLGVRRRIDFDEVNEPSGINFAASAANAAGCRRDAGFAIEAFGEDPRDGRLADTTGTCEQKRVMDAPGLERVRQRPAHVLLPDELCKFFGAPCPRQSGISHLPLPALPAPLLLRDPRPARIPVEPRAQRVEMTRTSRNSGTRHHRCRCCLPALTGFTTGRRGEADTGHHN